MRYQIKIKLILRFTKDQDLKLNLNIYHLRVPISAGYIYKNPKYNWKNISCTEIFKTYGYAWIAHACHLKA